MSLKTELVAAYDDFHANAPAQYTSIVDISMQDFIDGFDASKALGPNDAFPDFVLSDATGKDIASVDLRKNGPLLVAFYRGEWCPYCNLELAAFQKHIAEFAAHGVTLVAISPELPSQALSTSEKNGLAFPVLSDIGNVLARKLGIVFAQPDTMRPMFDAFEINFVARYGDASLEVPIPATYLVGRDGIIRNAFIDPDYSKRLEPSVALEWIEAMSAHR